MEIKMNLTPTLSFKQLDVLLAMIEIANKYSDEELTDIFVMWHEKNKIYGLFEVVIASNRLYVKMLDVVLITLKN